MHRPLARVAPSIVFLVLALGLAACSTPTVVATPSAALTHSTGGTDLPGEQSVLLDMVVNASQKAIPDTIEQFSPIYSDFQILAVQPNGLEYVWVYADYVDPAIAGPAFDTQLETFQTEFDEQVFPVLVDAGIVDPIGRVTYKNADGSVIWTHDFVAS